uniref:TolC family protein n=1 Tax=Alistipes sp. TaxID=1872444 RepID=UPI004056B769
MKRLLILLHIVLLGATLRAEEVPLSLEQALEIARQRNLRIEAQHKAEERAERLRRSAVGLRSPQLSLIGNYSLMERDVALPLNELKAPLQAWAGGLGEALPEGGGSLIAGLLSPLMATDWDYTLQRRNFGFLALEGNLPIWMGGRINTANRIARLEVERTRWAGVELNSKVSVEVIERYFAVVLGGEARRLREAVVEAMRQHLSEAEALVREGMIPEVELLYVNQRLSEAQHKAYSSRLELQTLKEALSTSLCTEVQEGLSTPLFSLREIEPLSHFLASAEAHNPQLREVELKGALSKEGVRMARSAFLPEVVAIGGVNLAQDHLSELLPRWVVGVGLRWSLFNGLRREHDYAAARTLAQEAHLLERYAEREVALLVEQCYNTLRKEADALQSLQQTLHYTEAALRASTVAFHEGEATALEVVDAELELQRVRIERLEAAYRYDVALAQLLSAAGLSESFVHYLHHPTAVYYTPFNTPSHETAD